ncbi:uncharacterized protein BDR25DRAFT_79655 [Lindgomyces ingoldianus]|uniref:Uncharacterized protein n=1 Tax=Lindgomyces ingoldianus TaxID=673940 RepID=A0ACB6QGM9_9PLEO|nr:uncharacterized protein BDR25DRAFT_79655 [Lindgomyces ingoldianus]KAF2466128.1 hypothetical protein BDR25DRAFT_79655 [Lindgomyces ingoldianus]
MNPSPLLRLPVELHWDIIDLLDIQDRARLACASQYFSSIIKPPTHQDFLAAETSPWATSRDLFTCKGCVRFRHLLQFTDDMRKGKRGRNGVGANTRFCIDCGVDQHWFPLGAEVTIMGETYVICRDCRKFTDQVGSKGLCNPCSPISRSVRKKRPKPNTGNNQYDSEDDWAYSTRSCAGGKHSEEMYGLWPDI